jgi:hypothetical protein
MDSWKYRKMWEEIRSELDRIFLPLTKDGHHLHISKDFSTAHLALILKDSKTHMDWIWFNPTKSISRDQLLSLVKVTPPISTDEELKSFIRSLRFVVDQET